MKEQELRKFLDCANCNRKILSSGVPLFWTLKMERHGVKLDAVSRQTGLAIFLGGNAHLAAVMGPDEDMTITMDKLEVAICEDCAMANINIGMLAEVRAKEVSDSDKPALICAEEKD
jgi:hypothetical protein